MLGRVDAEHLETRRAFSNILGRRILSKLTFGEARKRWAGHRTRDGLRTGDGAAPGAGRDQTVSTETASLRRVGGVDHLAADQRRDHANFL